MARLSGGLLAAHIALWIGHLCSAVRFDGNDFMNEEILKEEEVKEVLLHELTGDFKPKSPQDHRLEKLQKALEPMWPALPKDAEGKLSHSVVRYALHRLMVDYYGWYVKGLEPDGGHRNASVPRMEMAGATVSSDAFDWVPEYMQWFLEKKMGGGGLSLRETAVLAASIIELASRESSALLKSVYKFWEMEAAQPVVKKMIPDVLLTYMITYLKEFNLTKDAQRDRRGMLRTFRKFYPNNDDLEGFLKLLQMEVAPKSEESGLAFEDAHHILDEASQRYSKALNNEECRNLKHFMLDREVPGRPGRLLISEFYKHGGFNADRWLFNEKYEYLMAIGVVDTSDPVHPAIIVPNYVSSKPQCLEVSNIFGMCCRNECESFLSKLELEFKSDTADPDAVLKMIENMGSDTIEAPRVLSETLKERLQKVADANKGKIPLHGRLFAQWMHHAYPRECPFPHEAGTYSPLTPDQWMLDKHESAYATRDEMDCHVTGNCAGGAQAIAVSPDGEVVRQDHARAKDFEYNLPWLDVEELLQEMPGAIRPAAEVAASLSDDPKKLEQFNSLVGSLLHKDVQAHNQGSAAELDV
eukprot:TRINITY_DN2107_c0_g1_i1.p1 TRINITY_DN2107_c0_g1~~TRINITY_DN2107_c0_g1_i1.p1  ORF type:complete len:583 (-),score=160.69 TRINITY_DN2107_c0_g1_i1:47-1795(-)